MARRIPTGPLVALVVGWSILLAHVIRWAPTVPATHVFLRDAVLAVVVIAWTVALVPLLTRAVDAARARLDGTPTVPPTPPPQSALDLAAVAKAIAAARKQTLKRGSKGDAVKWLQIGINRMTGAGLTVSGTFDARTEQAVRDLQTWFRLTVDGIVGRQTWRLLFG